MIKKILKFLVLLMVFSNITIAFASDINHFEVIVNPTKVSLGEAVDLTIKAVDSDNNIIKDYEGTILIFSESDKKAEFPNTIEDNSYTFKKSDEGVVKFENSIKFSKIGKNDIHIYDLGDQTDSVFGLAEVDVTEKAIQQNVDINILTPDNGLTVGVSEINISGKTVKNHQIKIILNNKKEILTTSDRDGIFEKNISGLEDGENVIKAVVLNSNSDVIGTSKEVLIKSDLTMPILNKVKIIPEKNIEVNTNLLAEVYASKGLSKVSIILNDGINILKEDTPGIYKGEFLAPKKEGTYGLDVTLENELGHKVNKKDVLTLNIIPKLTSAQDKSGIVVKKKKDKCVKGDFSGDVFDGKCGEKPEDYNAPLDLGIRNLKIIRLKTKSILIWDKVDDAIKYEVYKKIKGDKLELIDTTKDNKYEIPMIGKKIKYEYFAIKALGTEELVDINDSNKKINKEVKGDLSEAIKVQTGPKEFLIIIIALLLGLGIMLFKRTKKV